MKNDRFFSEPKFAYISGSTPRLYDRQYNIWYMFLIRKFSEKTFFHTLKFLSGTADIVSVRTKHLSDGKHDFPTGRSSNPR